MISIGGLRVGGSGKTPFACWMAQRLRDKGYRVAVLTRGYGRAEPGETLVLHGSGDETLDPDLCGDEPCLLASSLVDVPVAVDARRYRGGVNVMRSFPVDVFLLDDGFQHLALSRDCDIVLLPEGEDPARMFCLPRGPLRESASALRDADMVVRFETATEGSDTPLEPPGDLQRYRNGTDVWAARMEPGELHVLGESAPLDPDSLQGESLFAFCGIARPRSFWNSLERAGLKVEASCAYPDHHRYTPRDHQELLDRLNRFQRAVTTEKDAVKLARFPWPPGKLLVLGLRPVLSREPDFWRVLEARLARARR